MNPQSQREAILKRQSRQTGVLPAFSTPVYQKLLTQPPTKGTLAVDFNGRDKTSIAKLDVQRLKDYFRDSYPGYQHYLNAWALALRNSKTPLSFIEHTTLSKEPVVIDGRAYTFLALTTIPHSVRQRLYQSTLSNSTTSSNCPLCANLEQTANSISDNLRQNALGVYQIGKEVYVLLVNKFPYFPGDSLLLRASHDDESVRGVFDKSLGRWKNCCREKTAGAVLTAEMLEVVFALADKYSLGACRNHARDGMSILFHDHFKLAPSSLMFFDNLKKMQRDFLVSDTDNRLYVFRAKNTPFDMLSLFCRDRTFLAKTASILLEEMEREGEIYTLSYLNGHLFILPRRKEKIQDKAVNTFYAANHLCFVKNAPQHLDDMVLYTPLQGEFKWDNFLSLLPQDANFAV